ncbi:hypothetical protein PIROE2DRAFT_21463 [Piromyces sp. E2]|nr:hypothetical protein PIROE2DRAFT_21463 [Piromyces sp. E2]|eukprot:OUM57615.1 hypothetical protein PIROE2DRAFT_21463 [Piromyces sp. E2]
MSNIPSQEVIGTLEITAISGSDIKAKNLVSKPTLYVVFEVGNKKQKTSEKTGKNPKWNEVVKFEVCKDSVLKANVYNSKYNEFVGGLEVLLKETIYVEKQNIKMKILNEKRQEKGELNLTLRFHKKVNPLNLFSNTQTNSNYAKTEEEENSYRKGNTYANSNESLPSSMYKNINGSMSTSNIPSKMVNVNGRSVRMAQNSKPRSRSLSPMVYDEVYGRNKNVPSSLAMSNLNTRSSSKDRLYHFKSDESLSLRQNIAFPNSESDNFNMNIFSQPSYGGYLDSQSDDELELYSSSLPTNSAFLSSPTVGQFGNYFYNGSKIPTPLNNNSIKVGQSPLKAEINGKYGVAQSLKSDSASLYSNNSGSNHSNHSTHSKSPSLVIKTSINSMKMGINSASTPRSSTPHTLTPLSSVTPLSSNSSIPTPTRGASFLPKPVQNNHRQSLMKSYVPHDVQNKRMEMEAIYTEPSQESNSEMNSESGRESKNNSSDGQMRASHQMLPAVSKVQYERSNNGKMYGPRTTSMAANPSLRIVETEDVRTAASKRRSYKVRSISNDSRLYKGRISLTSNNTITSLEDSFNVSDHHVSRISNGTDNSNRYSSKSSSYSTEVLIIDSSLDNSDQRSSSLIGRYLSSNESGRNSLRRSASLDSFIKEKSPNHRVLMDVEDEIDGGGRGRRFYRDSATPKVIGYIEPDNETVFRRPAKSKDRFKENKESENSSRYLSVSKQHHPIPNQNQNPSNGMKEEKEKEKEEEEEEEEEGIDEDSTTTFSKNLSLSRHTSLKQARHYRNGSPVSVMTDKRLLKKKSSSNSETSTTSDDKSSNLSRKVKELTSLPDDYRTGSGMESSDDSQDPKVTKKYGTRRSSLSSKALQQNLLLKKDMKPVKVISPSSVPVPNQAKVSTVQELRESVRPSEALYTNVNNLSSYAKTVDGPKEIDLLQKELNKLSLSLKMKKMGKSRSNSDSAKSENSVESNGSNTTVDPVTKELPGSANSSAHSSPRMLLNNKIIGSRISSANTSPSQSPKSGKMALSANGMKVSDTDMTSTDNISLDEGKSQEYSDDNTLNSIDKKDKVLWKDKYLRYIRKNSIQNRSKLDQCISEANSDSDGAEVSFNGGSEQPLDYSYGKDSVLAARSSSDNTTFEEVKIIDATYSSINMSNSAINISKIQFSDEEEDGEHNNTFIPSQDNYPQFVNVSLSTINQDDDLVSDKEYDITTPDIKMSNDCSYEIMNSKDGNISTSYLNSQEILSRTNLSSISFNNDSSDALLSPISPINGGSRNSTERKKIMDNNLNLLSQQIQKIRSEVVANSSMEDSTKTLHLPPRVVREEEKSDNDFVVDPPRLDSNVDMNEAIGNLHPTTSTTTTTTTTSSSSLVKNSSLSSSQLYGKEASSPKRPPKNIVSRKRDDSLAGSKTFGNKNMVIKPILKNSTPTSSANSTPTQKNLELDLEEIKKLHSESSRDALTPLNHEAYDQCSNTSTISTNSSNPTLHLEEDTIVYPTNPLEEKEETQATITRTAKMEKETKTEEELDEDMLTPKLHQAPFTLSQGMSQSGNMLLVPGSAIQADIYDISFGEESDDEQPPLQPPRTHSLDHRPGDFVGRMRSNSLSSIVSSTYSIHNNNWDDDESVLSSEGDEKAARRLTFGMDTNEQLFKIRRSNSLSSISTTSSYTYTLITKDSEKSLPSRNKLSQLISNSYAPQRIPPVRPMVNISNPPPAPSGLRPPFIATNISALNYASSMGSAPFSSPALSKYDGFNMSVPYPPDLDHRVGSGIFNNTTKIPNPTTHLSPYTNTNPNPNFYRPGSPNGPVGMNDSMNYIPPPSNRSTISSSISSSTAVKPQKSHKRFGHFKKGSISNLPVNTFHPLTHHGYKGDESFVTEEAANFQLKNAVLLEEGISNASITKSKSKPSRIPFLSHKRNNSSISSDSKNGTGSTVNVLSSSKLEMHPITNQL